MLLLLLLQEEEEEKEDVPCEMPTAAIAPCQDLPLFLASWVEAVAANILPSHHLMVPPLRMNLLHPHPQHPQHHQ